MMDTVFRKSDSYTHSRCQLCDYKSTDYYKRRIFFYLPKDNDNYWYRVCTVCEKLPDLQERLNVLYTMEKL